MRKLAVMLDMLLPPLRARSAATGVSVFNTGRASPPEGKHTPAPDSFQRCEPTRRRYVSMAWRNFVRKY